MIAIVLAAVVGVAVAVVVVVVVDSMLDRSSCGSFARLGTM